MADNKSTARSTRSKGRGFGLLTKRKPQQNADVDEVQPASHVPHYSPVSPVEEDNKLRMPENTLWPGQISPSLRRDSGSESSLEPASLFDNNERPESTELTASHANEEQLYNLKPPPPSVSQSNMELLAGRLFSVDHLDFILGDHVSSARFTRFLNNYRPEQSKVLKQYSEAKKAVLAIEYANTLAGSLQHGSDSRPTNAASLDRGFQSQMNHDVDRLVNEALPAYITHRLTQLVTDYLVKEITQNNVPIMREMLPNLAEVYCITDPALPDNPIVYASQEFYNVSQYGREYVIGRNCRFLQGPKTSRATIGRLIEALNSGQEVCETVLNYRRDGTPFMNLLLIAPLYDNKGEVRYFLGCQIDVSPLIEGGRGLDSFEQLLSQDRAESRFAGALTRDPKHALTKFGQMLSEEESSVVRSTSRAVSETSSRTDAARSTKPARRIIGADEVEEERPLWPQPSLGPSGRLPGVYQNYLLLRPFPSLRITFTSPALRIPGLLQTKFLDRIGGPQYVREGILDAMAHATGVTAKIQWLTKTADNAQSSGSQSDSRPRWIHCTPLLGSDEKVGVWMVVMVENEAVTGQLRRPMLDSSLSGPLNFGPIHSSVNSKGSKSTRDNLYAEYLHHGRQVKSAQHSTRASERGRTVNEEELYFE